MCALCGLVGGQEHWSNGVAFDHTVYERRRFHEDTARLLTNLLRPLRIDVSPYGEDGYIVRSATGAAEIASHLTEVWTAVARISGRLFDPLELPPASGPATNSDH